MDFNRNIIWLDLDGVFADFEGETSKLMGKPFHDLNSNDYWDKILKTKNFWLNIPILSESKLLIDYLINAKNNGELQFSVLTGLIETSSIDNKCVEEKTLWAKKVFGDDVNVYVVSSKNKYMFCRQNDILIDDKEDNIEKWNNSGGVGIHYTSNPNEVIDKVKNLYNFSNKIRSSKERAKYFSGYEIDIKSLNKIMKSYGPSFNNFSGNHITRFIPARNDLVENIRPEVKLVGFHKDKELKVEYFIAEVNGSIIRPDDAIYHLTWSYDKDKSSGKMSNVSIKNIIEEKGVDSLFNITDTIDINVIWKLFERNKDHKRKKIRRPSPEKEEYQLPDGGRKLIYKSSSDIRVTYLNKDSKLHNDDGPAITLYNMDGDVLEEHYYINGKISENSNKSYKI